MSKLSFFFVIIFRFVAADFESFQLSKWIRGSRKINLYTTTKNTDISRSLRFLFLLFVRRKCARDTDETTVEREIARVRENRL